MPDSVYKEISIVGSSHRSWEEAAQSAIDAAGESLTDLRHAEVTRQDIKLDELGKVLAFRTWMKLTFKVR
ncbi:MAG: dodecin domain-containing protein [Magnetococcales bacterium]|nr:dodecin domain-containing protein [Magnetococcales bacterium]